MSTVKLKINSRKFFRKKVTELFNNRTDFSNYDVGQRTACRNTLVDHSNKLKELDQQIQEAKWGFTEEESGLDEELETCESYCQKIRDTLAILDNYTLPISPLPSKPLLKSPVAPLPTFSSKEGEDLNKFFYQLEEVLNKYQYTDYERLLILKQQVKGKALILIDSLETENQGYSEAKKLLETALASTEIQKFNTMKMLSQLKLDKNAEPFEYMSKMKNISEILRNLKLTQILCYSTSFGLV